MAYNADSIQVRDFRTAARTTPGMYIGADGQDAMFNCFLEILNNACDEAIMGRGKEIIVEVNDNEMRITDFGAGVPHGKNKDTEEVLIEIYTSAHSSGKFDSTNYKRVRGMHGIGSSTVCVCSKVFDVWTRRDGGEWFLEFNDGIPRSPVAKKLRDTKETGTTIWFEPDKSIFHLDENTPAFDKERVRNELRLTSYFIPGVTFTYRNGEKIEKFLSKNGLKDFAADNINKPLHKQYIYGQKTFDEDIDIEVFAQWTAGREKCYVFSNGALNSGGGTPVTGMKAAFTRTINDLAKESFDGDMIRKGLVTIINIKHPHPIYQNQVKDKIQNQELRGYTQTAFTEAIKNWAASNAGDLDKIITLLTKEAKADAAAEKARNAVLNMEKKEQEQKKRKISSSDKFKDCEKHGQESMLIISEGNSALGGLMPARDVKTEALYAVRGKVKNLMKHPLDECLENQEVSDIILALGCGIQEKYNARKLNYGKVAIATDADVDGYAIMCLIATMFYVLMPKFIEEGRLCWLRAPLYRLSKGNKRVFAYDDAELAELRKKYPDWEQGRNKGLGEMTSEDMEASMMSKTDRHLEVLTIGDAETAAESLKMLMGPDVDDRRDFLFENVDFSIINS
jgi:DNA gyrase/topoisomerase IV subunit B